MNILDIFIAIVLLYSMIMGLRHGFIRIICEVMAMAWGLWLAMTNYHFMAVLLQDFLFVPQNISPLAGFTVIWGGVFITITALGIFLDKMISPTLFGPINVLGGMILGVVKGLLFLLPFLFPMFILNVGFTKDSLLFNKLIPIFQWIQGRFSFESLLEIFY
ncbi:MAG: CvpA family protein [Candidatus Margulisbacteria bacterium]|nr:CvpA family protein [Candidatus Margulisiibacteriota bacterium]